MRRPFEGSLDVLERNKLIEYGALAMLGAGPLLFALFVAGVFAPGVLGLHLTGLGLFLWITNSRVNMRASARRANVRADHDGVWADGKLVVPRARIADGFFQPRASRDPSKASSYGSSVRVVDRRRRVVFEAATDERQALEMLYGLGLDAGSKRAEFNGSSPVHATAVASTLFAVGSVAAFFILSVAMTAAGLHTPGGAAPILIVLLLLGGLLPSKIAVGVDGILVHWLWRKKFISMSTVTHVECVEDRAIRLHLAGGADELLYTSVHPRNRTSAYAIQHRDAVFARISEALATFRARGPAADVSALVGKGKRTRSEWLAALGKLRDAEGGYRDAVVREEDLWRVVEDPSAPEDARGGAAMLLRRSLDDAGRARVRVAAEATASPKLRVALDAAAGEDDEPLGAALEDLADDETSRRA